MRTIRSIFAGLLLAHAVTALAQPIDQIPMYGGIDRTTDPTLREADQRLISQTTEHYGSREKASSSLVGNGFAYYGRDDLVNAMRRFNQAWLLDPNNPEVYWGFGAIRHDQGNSCEAMTFFDKAASFGKYIEGMAPDAARVKVLCAVNDKTLTDERRKALYAQADALYAEALLKEPKKGYVHASMASAFYWRGKYAEAWASVKLARESGAQLPQQFLRILGEKMPEPS